jgi:N-acetylglutamate synthase-like GNAT family acetyltransferase
MQKTYTAERIRPEEHVTTLGRLWRDNLAGGEVPDDLVARRMRWFLEENPAGPPRTWLGLHGPAREVIGCASIYARATYVAGRRLMTGILSDFAVDKAHRIAGAAMAIQRALAQGAREAGIELVYGFPNRASFPIFQRAGFQKIAEAAVWVKPLTAGYKLRDLAAAPPEARRETARAVVERVSERAGAALPSDRWRALWQGSLPLWMEDRIVDAIEVPDHPLVRAVVAAGDAALAARDAARLAARLRRTDGELTTRADDRFDELWSRARLGYILGERSAAYLNWRYATFKTAEYRFFCVSDRADGRLIGYVVYTLQENKVVIVDLFCDDLDTSLELVTLKLGERLRREGHEAMGLIYVGAPSFGQRLRALGFFQRALPKEVGSRWLVARVDDQLPADVRAEVLKPERWYMPEGEIDA